MMRYNFNSSRPIPKSAAESTSLPAAAASSSAATTPLSSRADLVLILSPPISPSGKLHKPSNSILPSRQCHSPSPYPSHSKSSSFASSTPTSTPTATSTTLHNQSSGRFPHTFPPMQTIDTPIYKPAPGTTENTFRQLIQEKHALERGPIPVPFSSYSINNYVDHSTRLTNNPSTFPMTCCAWDRCRSKNPDSDYTNYKRGADTITTANANTIYDPFSLAVHKVSQQRSTCQSTPSTPRRSNRRLPTVYPDSDGVLTRSSALGPRVTRVSKEYSATNNNSNSSNNNNNNNNRHNLSGLATLSAAAASSSNVTLPPIRSIHGTSSQLLPSISSLSNSTPEPQFVRAPTHQPSFQSYSNTPTPEHFSYPTSTATTPIQSPRVGFSSVNNTPTSHSFNNNLRVQASTPRRSNGPKSSRPSTPRKRVAPILSRVHDMDPEEVPDYTPSAANLPAGKVLRAEWKGTPMDLSSDPNINKIHPSEVSLAATLRLSVAVYLDSKKRLFAEKVHRYKQGLPFRRTDSQKACRIDVNKASRLFMAFEKVGWLEDYNFEKFKDEPLITSRT